MCGFSGFINSELIYSNDELKNICHTMSNKLMHRGPDDHGKWVDEKYGVALGHRRLSIIDGSFLGHQPMLSASERMVIAYNGEVYNFPELRKELEQSGVKFNGNSDTEIVLAASEAWGVEKAAKRFIGMFAFALWDQKEKKLWLVRDRMGIKPLYWTQTIQGALIFGSELKALRAHPNCPYEIDRDSVASFLRHNYIPAPWSIYKNIYKLLPGHILCFDQKNKTPIIKAYWDLLGIAQKAQEKQFSGSDEQAIDALHDLLMDSVGKRMIADVPLGSFLSGGIDSSLVTALMQAQSNQPINSFSIGFQEQGYNEAEHAKKIAQHLGANHTELYITNKQAMDVIPQLPQIYDEPFSDSSQISTYLLSAMTRKHVTVALSGDGGDELFAGYNRYFQSQNLSQFMGLLPDWLRKTMATGIHGLSPSMWDRLFSIVPPNIRPPQAGDKMYKLANIITKDSQSFYTSLISHWQNPSDIVRDGQEKTTILQDQMLLSKFPNYIDYMQYADSVTYLPDDILTKVDRASMAVSLEARVPLIDHRVVEFSWNLPQNMKIRHGKGKWILQQILGKYVPTELFERPKMGFGIPLDQWLRGPLRDWAESLLSPTKLKEFNLLHSDQIQEKWREYLTGKRNWQYLLWDVLMLQAWIEHQTDDNFKGANLL